MSHRGHSITLCQPSNMYGTTTNGTTTITTNATSSTRSRSSMEAYNSSTNRMNGLRICSSNSLSPTFSVQPPLPPQPMLHSLQPTTALQSYRSYTNNVENMHTVTCEQHSSLEEGGNLGWGEDGHDDPSVLPNHIDRMFQVAYPAVILGFVVERFCAVPAGTWPASFKSGLMLSAFFGTFLIFLWIFAIASQVLFCIPWLRRHTSEPLERCMEEANEKLDRLTSPRVVLSTP
eukprot:GHVQ01028182.1.p1 GENE.GHVQ01028182.1~~GHVQ01028182.1.p1  ORF type:complete len:232 (-),score=28.70 GHVQ01028182.1:471-1166(-)